MMLDIWLPLGFELPNKSKIVQVVSTGVSWQIFETTGKINALIIKSNLAEKWIEKGLLDKGHLNELRFGEITYFIIYSTIDSVLIDLSNAKSPESKTEALAFSLALKNTRTIDSISALNGGIYVEKLSIILPTWEIDFPVSDDLILGAWLTGGVMVSIHSFRRLHQLAPWISESELHAIVDNSGILENSNIDSKSSTENVYSINSVFALPGRPELELFFNENVIDIIKNKERYKALGIGFPSAIILQGPPGCGKTYAVEQLINYLGWSNYQVDASSIASPYIHETSRKVAEVFDKAIKNSPSVLVIDEMDAFLTDRNMSDGQHRVEEVAEFLRRIPEASKNEVLIIAMTNKIDMIDSAILRRGRFDHILHVDFAKAPEIASMLKNALAQISTDSEINIDFFAEELAGKPLSDVAFLVQEGARLAAKSGKDLLDQESLEKALEKMNVNKENKQSRIGFL